MKYSSLIKIVVFSLSISVALGIIKTCPCDLKLDTCDTYCCCDQNCPKETTTKWKNNQLCSYETYNTVCFNKGTMYSISNRKAGIQKTDDVTGKDLKCIKVDKTTIQSEPVEITAVEIGKLNSYIDLQGTVDDSTKLNLVDGLEKHISQYSGFQIAYNGDQFRNTNYNNNDIITCNSANIAIGGITSGIHNVCVGESVHIYGSPTTLSVSRVYDSKSFTCTPGLTTKCLIPYTKAGFFKNPIYKQNTDDTFLIQNQLTAANFATLDSQPYFVRTDIVTDNIDYETWMIENQKPKTPTFFPQLPPDIFYPIWFESYSQNLQIYSMVLVIMLFSVLV